MRVHFPFAAILGQDRMKLALILALIDSKMGGVLLTGQQGTGKSTSVRSLQDLLQQKAKIVTLPLGSTEDMLIGSVDVEELILTGKVKFNPGLFARAHRGLLYVDEINLLQDHLVDLLLDVSASGVNYIEREGLSMEHPARFVLVGSMNPEEGELRPQISDRFGLVISIHAPTNPIVRAEITRRIFHFEENPHEFCMKYQSTKETMQSTLEKARKILTSVVLSPTCVIFASQLVLHLGFSSQRAEIVFLRCARALAAYHQVLEVGKEHLREAMFLVFSTRSVAINPSHNDFFLGNTFDEIWHKIHPGYEDIQFFHQTEQDEQLANMFKFSPEVYPFYKENPLNSENADLPEIDSGTRDSQDQFSNYNLNPDSSSGYKVGKNQTFKQKTEKISEFFKDIPFYQSEAPLKLDFSVILDLHKHQRRVLSYTGRGSRVRVLSTSNGRMTYARKPRGRSRPHSIAFDASIKAHYLHFPSSLNQIHSQVFPASRFINPSLAINLTLADIREKIFSLHAPLSLFFIVDASASMRRTLEQTIKIIQSVHAEGYKKKDKVSVISFQGRQAETLQRPSVTFSVGLQKLRHLEATSYTPLAAALMKTLVLIRQEQIKGMNIPVIIILSDLGANISQKNPELNANSTQDFLEIAQELDEIAQKIGKRHLMVLIMKPMKSFATRYLGVDPISVQKIEQSFLRHSKARVFEYDAYNLSATILKLKQILEEPVQY